MKTKLGIALILFICCSFVSDFREEQKKYVRVREAYTEKLGAVQSRIKEMNLQHNNYQLLFRVFKQEQEMELWLSNASGVFVLYKKWSVCAMSGDLGPKRKQGDYQVPEGFYYIDRFNPSSSFHLSLGINYPNASDRVLSDKVRPGGDIFIHGSCVSIGCMAMTDEVIKEVYVLAVEAKNNGQARIPVQIFPFRMTEGNKTKYYASYPGLKNFWAHIAKGYQLFETSKKVSAFTVNEKGEYTW